jgi:hypothetical protein
VNIERMTPMELLRILALVYLFAVALYLAVRFMDVALGFEDFQDSASPDPE